MLPVLGAASCDRTPSGVREWRPSDHDRADEPSGRRADNRSVGPVKASAATATPSSAQSNAGRSRSDAGTQVSGNASATAATSSASAAAAASANAGRVATLVDLAWRSQCARCHGASGRGDGPDGVFVRAPDLTRPDLQARVTDQDMANAIIAGKNRMPKFDLSPEVVAGLVQRIRFLKARD